MLPHQLRAQAAQEVNLQPTYKMPVTIVLRAMFYFVISLRSFLRLFLHMFDCRGFHMGIKPAVPWSLPSQKKAIPTKQGLRRTRKQRIELSVKKA